MTDSDDDFNSVFNNPLPPKFIHWPLDLDIDDDEFRARYPFSDVPEMEPNESWKSCDLSSTFGNHIHELNDSDDCNSTRKENEQVNDSSTEQQKEKVDVQLASYLVDERCENQKKNSGQLNNYNEEKRDKNKQMNSNQLNNYSEQKRDDDHQYDSANQDKETDVEKFKSLNQIGKND
ncbi:unnamed protein product [Rotaria sordida]|uniref:Uncharacterized protein n=1 Tax=Rotaria sordida TaxID=392033 RepID=A0A815GGR1_9BILA|nr:unnamed protein product [Rotaria sordida]